MRRFNAYLKVVISTLLDCFGCASLLIRGLKYRTINSLISALAYIPEKAWRKLPLYWVTVRWHRYTPGIYCEVVIEMSSRS